MLGKKLAHVDKPTKITTVFEPELYNAFVNFCNETDRTLSGGQRFMIRSFLAQLTATPVSDDTAVVE